MNISKGRACGQATILSMAVCMTGAPVLAQPLSEAEAVRRALAQPELAALAEANRDEAQARVSGIRPFDNPQVSISRESVAGDGAEETEWEVGFVQPIDISGRRSSLRAAARAEVGAVLAETSRRRQERVAEVRRAYAACAAGTAKAPVAGEFAERLREAERIVAARAEAGDAAVYDLRRLRVEARAAEASLTLQQGETRASCATLAVLTGTAEARPTASMALLAMAPAPAAAVSRPDLLARERRLAAAGEELRAARRARLPDLEVGVGLKQVNSDEGSAAGPVVSVGMTVPLWDGGGAAIAQARARMRAREAELGLARREVDAAVAAARARSEAALEAARRAEAAAEDADRLGPIAEAAYQGGEGGIVELVDAYRAARDARLEIIDHLERAVLARIDLELAQGGE